MRRIATSLAIASALLISAGLGHSHAQSGQPTTVRVGWIGDTHFTDMYLMSEEMKDPSIKLQMNKFQLSQDEVNALAANSLDMASMGYIFFLKLLDKGVDVTAVSGVSERGTRVLVRKGVTVSDWSDFKKLKVGVARGSTQELQFQSCLAENKIEVKSVNSIAFTNAVDMTVGLEQGAVDAAVIWEPQASQAVLRGIATEFKPVYPCAWSSNGMLVVRTEFLKKNRAAVVSILRGLASAADRLTADHEFWITTARKFAPLSPEIQALAVKNSGQSVTLHTADLSKMAAIMHTNSYLQRKLEPQEIESHIDLAPLAEATGKSKDELKAGKPGG
jgi:ABC-type nitrate/sulfonate/bicarbonate transport system substrate-binding protein